MRELVPTGNEVPALLEQVSTAARRTGLELAGVQPEPVVEGERFDTYRYRLTVSGGYHDVAQLLTNIGSLPRIVAPGHVTLATSTRATPGKGAPTGEAMIDTRFVIQTYVMRAGRPAGGAR